MIDKPNNKLTLAIVPESELPQRHFLTITKVDLEAPWRWLTAGWRDLWAAPSVGLVYGTAFAAGALGLWAGLGVIGLQSLMLALAGGFLLIGPILAVGLYETSRRLSRGRSPGLREALFAGLRAPGQLSLLGLALLLIYLAWVETALLLFMLFFSDQPFPPLSEFVPRLLYTWQGLTLLIVGTVEGAVLAMLVFSITAVSAPMLLDRPVGAAAAIFTSVRAVTMNWKPMALWAILIAALMGVGFATLGVGLIVIFPWIGHATWHAYVDLIGPE